MESPINLTLKEYLNRLSEQGHNLTKIVDENNFNLLHHCVLKGNVGKLRFLVDTVK